MKIGEELNTKEGCKELKCEINVLIKQRIFWKNYKTSSIVCMCQTMENF